MPAALRWVIVTGEFPPARGGVGDYTAQLAHALAETGDEVHVIAPPGDDGSGEVGSGGVAGGWFAPGASVHRLPDHFGVRSLAALRAILKSIAQPRVLLLQYVPHAFGHRNMNIPFCAWWAAQRDERRAVMFHEVASPIQWRKAVKESVLGTVHRVMGRLLVEGADAIFLSTDAWRPLVQSLGATDLCVRTLPIPSNLPTMVADAARLARRHQLAPNGERLIGSFGSFGALVAPATMTAVKEVLRACHDVRAVLIGRGARRLAERLLAESPDHAERLLIADDLPAKEAAVTIAACDLMLQPYPDGITSRRSTAMASLALGKVLVTNAGALTESSTDWASVVRLVESPSQIQAAVVDLLNHPASTISLGERARRFYDSHFSLEMTIQRMRLALSDAPARRGST